MGSATHSFGPKEVVVQRPEPLPGVVASVRSAHQVLDDQSDVDQADSVIRGQVTLETEKSVRRQTSA